jgi:glutathione-regulated potassium-efflux system ancillary protein KefG
VNSALAAAAVKIDAVQVHDLYDAYPDYQIDVRSEQRLLLEHNLIGLQFPLFWYFTPALLKEWFDLVWLHGFAYGGPAPRLAGKHFFCAVTTGGDADSYRGDGRNAHTVAEFLRPIERSAALCGMVWEEPHILHDAPRLTGDALQRATANYDTYLRTLLKRSAAA